MDKWIKIFYLSWFLLFTAVPVLYKSKHQSMLSFYKRMLWLHSARRLYSLVVFLLLIAFHFYYLTVFKNHYDVIPSTAIAYALCSHRLFERAVRFLQNQRTLWFAMIAMIVFLFTPHFFALGVTVGIMMLAAVFYPSKIAIDRLGRASLMWYSEQTLKSIPDIYHRWDAMEGAKLVKASEMKAESCSGSNPDSDGGVAR